MKLAKPALDVGLYTNQLDAMLSFWQSQPGIKFDELLPVGGGVRQHRHRIGDSILKLNHARDPLPAGPDSNVAQLELFTPEGPHSEELTDPDGNRLLLSPQTSASPNLRLWLRSEDEQQQLRFYQDAFDLPITAEGWVSIGASQLAFQTGPTAQGEQRAKGFRYVTVQVYDVVATHQQLLNHGAQEGMAPVRLGEVAYISFVRDPDGNWIEISQRKSITGSLD